MTEPKLTCENSSCQKNISAKTYLTPMLSLCCSSIFCPSCFDEKTHTCEHKKSVFTEYSQTTPCSRCKIKSSAVFCSNCSSEFFCQQCCKAVHSGKKFSFHKIVALPSVKKSSKEQKLKDLEQSRQKQNIQNPPKKIKYQFQDSNSYKMKEYNLVQLVKIQQKMQNYVLAINLTKSSAKIQQVSIKQKWAKLQKLIDDCFLNLQQRIMTKFESVKLMIKQQGQLNYNQSLRLLTEIKNTEVETINVKSLIAKNKRTQILDTNFLVFLEQKCKIIGQRLKNYDEKVSSKDSKCTISKEFLQTMKKFGDDIQSMNICPLIKHEQSKICREDNGLNGQKQKQRKKTILNYPKGKNYELETVKKMINISYSQNEPILNLKPKKRKISIQLFQVSEPSQTSDKIDTELKNKELSRIKSFDYLSSTKTSLSSVNEIKTQKKMMLKIQEGNMSKRYPSDQQLSLSFIRDKIQNRSFMEQMKPINLMDALSQQPSSAQTLPVELNTTRPKLVQLGSPKANMRQKPQVTSNFNKTYSTAGLLNSMGSPSNKINTTSVFRSTNVKQKNFTQKKPQSFSQLSSCDQNRKGMLETRKNEASYKLLMATIKE